MEQNSLTENEAPLEDVLEEEGFEELPADEHAEGEADSHGHDDHSPLSQFEVQPIIPIKFGNYDVSFTNASLWMVLAVLVATGVLFMGARARKLVPGRWQSFSEIMVQFMSNTLKDVAGESALRYFPLIFSLFIFVLLSNLLGMLPYSFTTTSHIIVTFALAMCIFIACTLLAIARHGLGHFLHSFLPEGTPLWMAPLMYFIELFSYLARPVSLSVRLSANMMAGHTMLKVIAGFVVMLGLMGGWAPLSLLVVLTGFEIGIAVLQAYIFTVLTCVYLSNALHLH